MEAVIEVLIHIIAELFGEIILTGIIKLIGLFYKKVDTDNLFRKRLKFVLTYIFIGLIMVVLISSIIHTTRYLVVISLSYMLFQIVVTLLNIINKDRRSHLLMKTIVVLKKISHYAYPILLIVFSSMYMEDSNLLATLISISVITLIVLCSMDLYRLNKKKS